MKKYPYLRTASATLICLINTVFACFSLFFLFRTIYTFGTLVGTLIHAYQIGKITDFLDHILDVLGHLSFASDTLPFIDETIHTLTASPANLGMLSFLTVFIFVIIPLLSILKGVGSFSLRFGAKGSQMLHGVHVTYAALDLIGIAALLGTAALFALGRLSLSSLLQVKKVEQSLYLVLICAAVLLLILFILLFFYHRDIASQMFYITAQRNNAPIAMTRNHLSVRCVLLTLLYLAAFIGLLYYTGLSTEMDILLIEAWLLLFAVKCICIAASNRHLTATAKHFI